MVHDPPGLVEAADEREWSADWLTSLAALCCPSLPEVLPDSPVSMRVVSDPGFQEARRGLSRRIRRERGANARGEILTAFRSWKRLAPEDRAAHVQPMIEFLHFRQSIGDSEACLRTVDLAERWGRRFGDDSIVVGALLTRASLLFGSGEFWLALKLVRSARVLTLSRMQSPGLTAMASTVEAAIWRHLGEFGMARNLLLSAINRILLHFRPMTRQEWLDDELLEQIYLAISILGHVELIEGNLTRSRAIYELGLDLAKFLEDEQFTWEFLVYLTRTEQIWSPDQPAYPPVSAPDWIELRGIIETLVVRSYQHWADQRPVDALKAVRRALGLCRRDSYLHVMQRIEVFLTDAYLAAADSRRSLQHARRAQRLIPHAECQFRFRAQGNLIVAEYLEGVESNHFARMISLAESAERQGLFGDALRFCLDAMGIARDPIDERLPSLEGRIRNLEKRVDGAAIRASHERLRSALWPRPGDPAKSAVQERLQEKFAGAGFICCEPDLLGELGATLAAWEAGLSVLLLGETGTGKGVLARALHGMTQDRSGPLVLLNCASIPEPLFESELFGHGKGAFTSAGAAKPGLVEQADGGTLFLDEVAELPPGQQGKLLAFLDSGAYRRVGEVTDRVADVRVLAATNRPLADLIREDQFRSDLYYRLSGHQVTLPPLRRRPLDLLELARRFLEQEGSEAPIDEEFRSALLHHPWPGNVRELRQFIRRVSVTGGSRKPGDAFPPDHPSGTPNLESLVNGYRKELILKALDGSGGNRSEAARRLGIKRSTLLGQMERLGIRYPATES